MEKLLNFILNIFDRKKPKPMEVINVWEPSFDTMSPQKRMEIIKIQAKVVEHWLKNPYPPINNYEDKSD
jgi:hypothetical protein